MPKRKKSPSTVIDLTLSDEEEDGHDDIVIDPDRAAELSGVRKRLNGSRRSSSNKKKRSRSSSSGASVKNEAVSVTSAASLKSTGIDDDDCMVVDAPERNIVPEAASASAKNDDELQVVGTVNEQNLPHMRPHCTTHKLVPVSIGVQKAENVKHCDLCYCFVCDVPSKDCKSWNHHCNAIDSGPTAMYWKNLRELAKNGTNTAAATTSATTNRARANASAPGRSFVDRLARASNSFSRDLQTALQLSLQELQGTLHQQQPLRQTPQQQQQQQRRRSSGSTPSNGSGETNRKYGPGPFNRNDAVAVKDKNLTKCRRCGWFNRFFHRNFRFYQNLHPVSFLDWCMHCGRVASARDFAKIQSTPHQKLPGEVYLGERVIRFRVFAHDPRKMKQFASTWEQENWTYNERDMREDLFQHRFSKNPTIQMIFESIPVEPKKLPTDGALYMRRENHFYDLQDEEMTNSQRLSASRYARHCCADKFRYWDRSTSDGASTPSADETEGIILENDGDLRLLQSLRQLQMDHLCDGPEPTTIINLDVSATFDKCHNKGAFTIKAFVRPDRYAAEEAGIMADFVATWFQEVSPIRLKDICGTLEAEVGTSQDASAQEREAVKTHNQYVAQRESQLSFEPSRKGSNLGGTSPSEFGLAKVLQRYYKEMLCEQVMDSDDWNTIEVKWGELEMNHHRVLRKKGTRLLPDPAIAHHPKSPSPLSHLRKEDIPLAINLKKSCREVIHGTKSLKSLVDHLENLGHAGLDYVDGLNVDLLPFQRQSVQWAIERETTPGGVQSFLWPKLPRVAEPCKDLYFNPILGSFRTNKPKIVRGGFLSSEMGLGKTIISLALILSNPAPTLPATGSNRSELAKLAETKWDKNLRMDSENPKRGQILSRGTLVICPVSLVGQWTEEAKSRLADPGQVYSYHGQSRKRDPNILARAAIVVTTYETIASDDNHHRCKAGKAGTNDYCPPLEQVRWWRIICDECHSLRDGTTSKGRAVMALTAEHKWLVSGTPLATSVLDLKSQLKFLGIEGSDMVFNRHLSKLLKHTNDKAYRASRRNRYTDPPGRLLGPFMFLMRALVIRHAQNQTHLGTSTTLMSLPPKTERTVEVEFTDTEKKEYAVLEAAAMQVYTGIRVTKNPGKHYLKLTSALMPMRIAAAGGHVPISGKASAAENGEDDNDGSDNDEEEDEVEKNLKKKGKRVVQYSQFAFKSKANALIKELKQARDKDPTSKSLVFSQFTSSLKYLEQELPVHGFSFRTLKGDMSMKQRANALAMFQNDPPTTVFLLSVRSGAVGINLTQANKVFLLEGSMLNPAVEVQSIGRVHRLGQKRNVEVVRLVMKSSIEQRIMTVVAKKYGTSDEKNAADNLLAGSISSDKAKILTDEFDTLFGYEVSGNLSGIAERSASGGSVGETMPDMALS